MLRLGTSDDVVILNEFLRDPTPFNGSRLISMPILYHMLKSELSQGGNLKYPQPILELVAFIHNRMREVLKVLLDRGAGLSVGSEMADMGDKWQQVSRISLQSLSLLK